MTDTKSLAAAHGRLLRAENRGDHLRVLFTDMSRLAVEAIAFARRLESESTTELLARRRQIAAIWRTEDVLEACPRLTPDQAWAVLQAADERHSAADGITWDLMEEIADEVFPDTEGVAP